MMRDFNAKLFLDRTLDFKQSRVAKLHHRFRLDVDEMVVLAELVRPLILCAVVPKLVLDDQAAVQQQVDGIVERGAANAVLVVFHLVVERVDVEVPVVRVNLLEDGETLRRLSKLPPL